MTRSIAPHPVQPAVQLRARGKRVPACLGPRQSGLVCTGYVRETPNLKNGINAMAWHQCMQCWKPYRQANIFKHVTKKIYVCVENGMANVIVLCTFGRRFAVIPVGEQ